MTCVGTHAIGPTQYIAYIEKDNSFPIGAIQVTSKWNPMSDYSKQFNASLSKCQISVPLTSLAAGIPDVHSQHHPFIDAAVRLKRV